MSYPAAFDALLSTKEELSPEARAAIVAMGEEALTPLVALLDDDVQCDADSPSSGSLTSSRSCTIASASVSSSSRSIASIAACARIST
ncbi:hypothetical protein EON77_01220, partial [bacterium]